MNDLEKFEKELAIGQQQLASLEENRSKLIRQIARLEGIVLYLRDKAAEKGEDVKVEA